MGRHKPQKPIIPPPPKSAQQPIPMASLPLSDLGNLIVAAKRGLQHFNGREFAAIANTIAMCEDGIARQAAAEQQAAAPAPQPTDTPQPQAAAAASG